MLTFAIRKKRIPSVAPKRHTPTVSPMSHSLHLQQAKVRHILRSPTLQPKLTIGQPNDKYEQEADRVADEVMRMPEPRLQRQVEPEEEEEETLQAKPLANQITPLVQVQRQEEPEEEEELQAKPIFEQLTPLVQRQPIEEEEDESVQTKHGRGQAPKIGIGLEERISFLKGTGQPLSCSARSFFEPRFGYDFSRVRVHTNIDAARVARLANAQALTVGQDIIFGAGHYASGTSLGRRLLAHELTHVIQQHKTASKQLQRKELHLYDPTDNFLRRWGYAKHYCANYSVITGMCLRRKPGKLHAAIYRVSDVGRMVNRFKVRNHKINEIIFHTHGNKGYVHLSRGSLDISNVRLLAGVSNQLERNARIDFMGCNVGEGKKGLRFIQAVGNVLLRVGGGTVCASDSVTLSVPGLGQRGPLWTKAKCLFFAHRGRPRRP